MIFLAIMIYQWVFPIDQAKRLQHILKDVAHQGNLLRLKRSLLVEKSVDHHGRALPARRCYSVAKGECKNSGRLFFALPPAGILTYLRSFRSAHSARRSHAAAKATILVLASCVALN
jgi:hypothetical protein